MTIFLPPLKIMALIISIGLMYEPFGFALISPLLQLSSLIGYFQICLRDHPGGIKVAFWPYPFPSIPSFVAKLIVVLTLRQLLPRFSHPGSFRSFCHCLRKAPGRNQSGPGPSSVEQRTLWESFPPFHQINWVIPLTCQRKISLGLPT